MNRHRFIAALARHVIDVEGSTRSVALMRIGLVFLLWTRWAGDLLPFEVPFSGGPPEAFWVGIPFFISTLLVLIGLWTRVVIAVAAVTLLVVYFYLGYGVGIELYTHHHTYLLVMATCLLAFTPCDRSYSLDRWLAIRSAQNNQTHLPPEWGPLWGMRLLALQLSAVYFWSAWQKTFANFFSGERIEQILMYLYIGSDYPTWPGFRPLVLAISWTTVILEFVLAFGLWMPRWRKFLLGLGCLFHLGLYYLLPVDTFSLTMCLLYLAYLDPADVHSTIDRVSAPVKP